MIQQFAAEDPWNIDAYLVHERAHVYSMELRDPQVGFFHCTPWIHFYLAVTRELRSVWGIYIPHTFPIQWGAKELYLEFPNHLTR